MFIRKILQYISLFLLAINIFFILIFKCGFISTEKLTKMGSDSSDIFFALQLYYLENNHYPDEKEGLAVLLPYMSDENQLIDVWGNPYEYTLVRKNNKLTIIIKSLGADNMPGGKKENKDKIFKEVIKLK